MTKLFVLVGVLLSLGAALTFGKGDLPTKVYPCEGYSSIVQIMCR